MSDPVKQLRAKFDPKNRYANFGPVVRMMRIRGFRGIADLSIEFDSPICALSGLNGAGKSTVGQLAVCAYKKPSTAVNYRRFWVKEFFPVSVADQAPFAADARVEYFYETNVPGTAQTVTVSRKVKEWSGYKRQPEGYCYYVGFTLYIPKVERRDLSVYRGATVELREKRPIPESVRTTVARILNQSYDDLVFQSIGHKDKEVELGLAVRNGQQYSENNMGFGEGRVLYMVDLMETTPEQSLFVLEEPETSLHEDAQYRLTRYFIEVCNRRHHQILMSTHSSVILDALPTESRKLLYRDAAGVTEYPGISSTRARAILSGGHHRALTVCVEDEFSKLVLTEILRRADAKLLKVIAIEPLGSSQSVSNGIRLLEKLGLKAIGVRDADVGPDPAAKLYSLPGARPPELEVFTNAAVAQKLKELYAVDVPTLLAQNPDLDPHEIPALLASEAELLKDALSTDAAQAYAISLDPAAYSEVVDAIRVAA
jgi:predicted ATPase